MHRSRENTGKTELNKRIKGKNHFSKPTANIKTDESSDGTTQ